MDDTVDGEPRAGLERHTDIRAVLVHAADEARHDTFGEQIATGGRRLGPQPAQRVQAEEFGGACHTRCCGKDERACVGLAQRMRQCASERGRRHHHQKCRQVAQGGHVATKGECASGRNGSRGGSLSDARSACSGRAEDRPVGLVHLARRICLLCLRRCSSRLGCLAPVFNRCATFGRRLQRVVR